MAQSHRLLDEHQTTLAGFGCADVAHSGSPLANVPGKPRCLRVLQGEPTYEPGFEQHIRALGIDLRGSVCVTCKFRKQCEAWQADRRGQEARVLLEPHASYAEREDSKRAFERVVFDEEPELFRRAELPLDRLAQLAAPIQPTAQGGQGLRFWSLLQPTQRKVLHAIAIALHSFTDVDDDLRADARRFGGRLRVSRHDSPDKWKHWPWFADAARALLVLAEADRIERDNEALYAVVPTDAYKAILSGAATLLSATPTPGAYDLLGVFRPAVADGCAGITREVHFSSASTQRDFGNDVKHLRRDRLDPILTTARGRCAAAGAGRVLLVTWSWLAAWLKEHPELLPSGCWVEHYGNVAGSNVYQQGGAREVDAVVSLGDPRAGNRWVFEHLARERGLSGPAAEAQIEAWWAEAAANELMQVHGRARDPRRTKPILHLHFGKIAPTSWHSNNTRVRSEWQAADAKLAAREVLSAVLAARWTQAHVAERCGVGAPLVSQWVAGTKPIAPEHLATLEQLRGEAGEASRVVRVDEAQTPAKQALTPPLPDFHRSDLLWESGNSLDTPLSAAVRALGSRSKVAQLVGSSTSAVTQVLDGKRKMPAGWAAKLAGHAAAPRYGRMLAPAEVAVVLAAHGDGLWAPLDEAA